MKYLIPLAIGIAVTAACRADPGLISAPYVSAQINIPDNSSTTVAVVPDSYVWDGYEYVGVVDNQYYYLGPGNVWMVMDPTRFQRFHVWARNHPDWRAHATQNVLYRNIWPSQANSTPPAAPPPSQPMTTPPEQTPGNPPQ